MNPPKFFQGKWAILYQGNNQYLSGDNNSIAANSGSIVPSATFILYGTTLESVGFGVFFGCAQLQGNMNYIAIGNCSADGLGAPGMCELVASAPDIGSAITLTWGVTPVAGFLHAMRTLDQYFDNGQGIGIVNWSGSCFFGFYTVDGDQFGRYTTTVITPGLYEITQSLSGQNGDFSYVDFTGQDFSGGYQFQGANFQQAILAGVNFSGSNLSGANFTGCDLTVIIYDSATVTAGTQTQLTSFNSARLPFTLINRNWQWLDLRNATVIGLPSPLSSSTLQLQATGSKLSGMNQNNFTGMVLEKAVLDYSVLDTLDLSGVDLTSASLIDASLHGANLSNATLVSANLTGAQLGSLAQLFTLPSSAEGALSAGQVTAVSSYFTQNGITLSSTATLNTVAANRVWQLDDAGNHITYTIRLETQAGATQVLTVYSTTTAASLVNAYLPNAILTGANLYGVLANGVQFYGSGALIDGSAILEEAQLNSANLSNLNLTQAQLMGTNLSGSYLFNAKFNKANLTPSANGVATNLSNSNMQGADFTDAQLYGANLTNAAVAINVPTQAVPQQGGVYLFSLPYTGDTVSLQQYTSELNAASTMFSLNPNGDAPTLQKYVSALENNNLALLEIPFLEQHPPIKFSSAQIETVEVGSVWQIIDGQTSYTLWTDTDESGNTELYAAPSLTNMQAAFQQKDITLRWQASVSIDTANQQWLIDNDSENPQNFSTGYVRFLLILNGSVLDVYGTALRILRLGDNNQQVYDTETCNVTVLAVTYMDGNTICPNGIELSVNQSESASDWNVWMRASAPPNPPTCVPTDYSWCPQTQTQADKQ
jgi:uncharacterized protein YjbI with pentapeptide repeats